MSAALPHVRPFGLKRRRRGGVCRYRKAPSSDLTAFRLQNLTGSGFCACNVSMTPTIAAAFSAVTYISLPSVMA